MTHVACMWVWFAATAASATAALQPHALFSDHAVLQRDTTVPVYGKADDGATVTVEFQGQSVSTAVRNGQWRVELAPLRAGGPFDMTIRTESETIKRRDILVGEVWFCAGQSNMGWGLGGSETKAQIAEHADLPRVRLIRIAQNPQPKPVTDLEGAWQVCTPHSAYGFPAVGYYFGRELHKTLDVPVGLIGSAVGGSFAHTWMPESYLHSNPQLEPLLGFWERTKQNYARRLAQYEAALAKAEDKTQLRPPGDNPAHDWRNMTAGNYNGNVRPAQPYAIRGALWYQGENDAGSPARYRVTLATLIRAWRDTWDRGDFPFIIVELPGYGVPGSAARPVWAQMRESQNAVADSLSNTATVVTIDCADPDNPRDVHPKNKEPVGLRAARVARATVYGEPIEHRGPTLDTVKFNAGHATLTFMHTAGKLTAHGGEPLVGFQIAGEDGKFVDAHAAIADETVIVSSDAVPNPAYVRYGWANNPVCNLYNAAGLPATSFRTDNLGD